MTLCGAVSGGVEGVGVQELLAAVAAVMIQTIIVTYKHMYY